MYSSFDIPLNVRNRICIQLSIARRSEKKRLICLIFLLAKNFVQLIPSKHWHFAHFKTLPLSFSFSLSIIYLSISPLHKYYCIHYFHLELFAEGRQPSIRENFHIFSHIFATNRDAVQNFFRFSVCFACSFSLFRCRFPRLCMFSFLIWSYANAVFLKFA